MVSWQSICHQIFIMCTKILFTQKQQIVWKKPDYLIHAYMRQQI